MNIIEPVTNYYKLGDKYSYDIKSYANDYELLTFYYLNKLVDKQFLLLQVLEQHPLYSQYKMKKLAF